MKNYIVYFIDNANRIETMLTCSLKNRIDWCEDGLKIVTWKYNIVGSGVAESLNDVFKHYSRLSIDKRKKKNTRTISIGDIVVFDEEAWIVSAFGFMKIPTILSKKIL